MSRIDSREKLAKNILQVLIFKFDLIFKQAYLFRNKKYTLLY
jgi:hypothetical protein